MLEYCVCLSTVCVLERERDRERRSVRCGLAGCLYYEYRKQLLSEAQGHDWW